MRLKVNGYDVEIAVREPDKRYFSSEATKQFLNALSLYASIASDYYSKEGYKGIASEAEKVADDIYRYLKEQGLYNF